MRAVRRLAEPKPVRSLHGLRVEKVGMGRRGFKRAKLKLRIFMVKKPVLIGLA